MQNELKNNTQEDLERKIQRKSEVIAQQIEVLDEYRSEILKLNKLLERKDQIIHNLKNLINENNGIKSKL